MATLTGKTVASTYTSLLKLEGNTGSTVAGASGDAVQVKTGDNDATPLYLNTDRMGIGTSAPDQIVEIAKAMSGSAGSYTGQPILRITQSGDQSTYNIGDFHSGIEFFTEETSGVFPEVQAYIKTITTRNSGISDADAGLQFGVTGLSATVAQAMTIAGSGNVGIGQESPASLLNIKSAVSTSLPTSISGAVAPYAHELFIENTANNETTSFAGIAFSAGTQSSGAHSFARIAAVKDGAVASSSNLVFMTKTSAGVLNENVRINPDGNVGIGVIPDDQWDTFKALQIGETGAISAHVDGTGAGSAIHITANSYYDSGWKHLIDGSDEASRYTQENGRHQFYTAPASTHANAAVFTEAVRITSDGGIYETDGVLKENLLTNSGFDVWSNSTLQNVGSDLVTNGAFSSDASSWNVVNSATLASVTPSPLQSGNCLQILENSDDDPGANQGLTTVVGKLYKLSYYVKQGTESTYQVEIGGNVRRAEATSSWVNHTQVFEAASTTSTIELFQIASSGAGTTLFFDTITCFEVTPGQVTGNNLGPDGWGKSTLLDCRREHSGSNVQPGTVYGIDLGGSSENGQYVEWPSNIRTPVHLAKFAGRTVTFGCWVKSDHSTTKVSIDQNDLSPVAATHTGGGAYEWLEVTDTIATDVDEFRCIITGYSNSANTYACQPMLVYGSSIGEGNYTRPQGEIIDCEKYIGWTKYGQATSHSSVSVFTLNLEAETKGMFPKGAKAFNLHTECKHHDSATFNGYMYLRRDANSGQTYWNRPYGLAGDTFNNQHAWVGCNSDGDIDLAIEASGSDTFDFNEVGITQVQLH